MAPCLGSPHALVSGSSLYVLLEQNARKRLYECQPKGDGSAAMIHPDSEQLSALKRFERVAFALCDKVNRQPLLKRAGHFYLKTFGASWVYHCTKNLIHINGIEHVKRLNPNRGVIFVANHRSFFDLYVTSSVLLRHTDWIERMYFPVRSTYFYERPDGVLVNAVMSALAMYPPILRDANKKRGFNQFAVEALAELCEQRGTIVGIHPEGTRGKHPDPYTLLPTQIGAGNIAYHAKAIVLPVFILGVSNDFVRQVSGNFDGRGAPITVNFGAPLELDALYAQKGRLAVYRNIADEMTRAIKALGEEDKIFRRARGLPSLEVPKPPKPESEAA